MAMLMENPAYFDDERTIGLSTKGDFGESFLIILAVVFGLVAALILYNWLRKKKN